MWWIYCNCIIIVIIHVFSGARQSKYSYVQIMCLLVSESKFSSFINEI